MVYIERLRREPVRVEACARRVLNGIYISGVSETFAEFRQVPFKSRYSPGQDEEKRNKVLSVGERSVDAKQLERRSRERHDSPASH